MKRENCNNSSSYDPQFRICSILAKTDTIYGLKQLQHKASQHLLLKQRKTEPEPDWESTKSRQQTKSRLEYNIPVQFNQKVQFGSPSAKVVSCFKKQEDLIIAPCHGMVPACRLKVGSTMESSTSPAVGDGQLVGVTDQLQPAAEFLSDSDLKPLPLKPADVICELKSDVQEHSPSPVLPPASPFTESLEPSPGHIPRSGYAVRDSVLQCNHASSKRKVAVCLSAALSSEDAIIDDNGSSFRGEGEDHDMDVPNLEDAESKRAITVVPNEIENPTLEWKASRRVGDDVELKDPCSVQRSKLQVRPGEENCVLQVDRSFSRFVMDSQPPPYDAVILDDDRTSSGAAVEDHDLIVPPFDEVESKMAKIEARIAAREASPNSASRIASDVERLRRKLVELKAQHCPTLTPTQMPFCSQAAHGNVPEEAFTGYEAAALETKFRDEAEPPTCLQGSSVK